MGNAGLERQLQGLRIHIGDHENRAASRFAGDADDQAVGVEFGREALTFLELLFVPARGEGGGHIGGLFIKSSEREGRTCAAGVTIAECARHCEAGRHL